MAIDLFAGIPGQRPGRRDRGVRGAGVRRLALALAVLGASVVVAAVGWVVVTAVAPWRLIALMPLEPPLRAALVVAGGIALLGVAGRVGLRRPIAARAAAVFASGLAALAVLVGGIGAASADLEAVNPDRGRVAVSADGRYELVVMWVAPRQRHYRLRSHATLLGREGKADVACTSAGEKRGYTDVPAVQLNGVRFTDGNRIELTMSDGSTVTVGFDPGTLRPERLLTWC